MNGEKQLSAGELLRQGRLKQRLSIAECAKRTHIAPRYLEALEDQRWEDLPSESHRLGFLRLYARFLGVPAEELIQLYHREKSDAGAGMPSPAEPAARRTEKISSGWYPSSWQQLLGFGLLLLLGCWIAYHALSRQLPEVHPAAWVRVRSHETRLVPSHQAVAIQHIRLQASADSWLRVTQDQHLLYEGILPAGASEEWSGSGTFWFKIGNVKGVSLYWNDQLVDIQTGAHSNTNDVQLPLPK